MNLVKSFLRIPEMTPFVGKAISIAKEIQLGYIDNMEGYQFFDYMKARQFPVLNWSVTNSQQLEALQDSLRRLWAQLALAECDSTRNASVTALYPSELADIDVKQPAVVNVNRSVSLWLKLNSDLVRSDSATQ